MSFSAYLQEGSGWVFDEVVKIGLRLADYVPLQGNSYIPGQARVDYGWDFVCLSNWTYFKI